MKYWELIPDNLQKSGWSSGLVSEMGRDKKAKSGLFELAQLAMHLDHVATELVRFKRTQSGPAYVHTVIMEM